MTTKTHREGDKDDDLADERRLSPASPVEGSGNLNPGLRVTKMSDLPAKGPRQI